MADSPTSVTPQSNPAISDPAMDTNQIYEHESERPQQVSPDSDIQLAQNEPPQIGPDTHHIVQAPDGAKVAFPKGTPPDTMHQEMTKWWEPHLQRTQAVWDSVRHAATNAAQVIGLPSDMPEWQKTSDEFVRDPVGTTGHVVGAIVGGFAHGLNSIIPNTPENKDMVAKAQAEYAQGNHLAAAVTMSPMVGDGLAKAVKQAQARDYVGSLGTSMGLIVPFLTDTFKGEGELPITREKPVQPTTTSYEYTPAQNGQFGNMQHVVTTKDLQGNAVGHLAAQDTAPGEVTERFSHVDEAHREQGKGTSQIRTLVNETAKNPELHKVHSDISTTPAARGSWEKFAKENPELVTKENIKGTPRWTVDLDKVRENAANAPEFNGEERRGTNRAALPTANEVEQGLKTGQPVSTIADQTVGAQDTINRGVAQELAREGPKPPKARAASAPTQSVGAASINDLNTKEDVPPFYSKAEQIIGEKVSNNASGDQIKNVLKNAGVKDDEMKWSGLDDYLSGKTKVSKADLQQYIAEHKLSVQDVDLGKEQRYNLTPNEEETTHAGEPMFDVKDPQNGLTRFTGTEHAAHDYMSELGQGLTGDEHAELQQLQKTNAEIDAEHTKQTSEQIKNLREARAEHGYTSPEAKAAEDAIDDSKLARAEEQAKVIARIGDLQEKSNRGAVTRQTQYGNSTGLGGGNGDWTVPGPKRNYQEKLLTLPNSEVAVTPERKAYTDFHDSLMRKYGVNPQDFNPDVAARPEGYQERIDAAQAKLTPEERQQGLELRSKANYAEADARKTTEENGAYIAPHFQRSEPQPNIVAHMRFSDRDAVNGKKTLFLEEAQSDWHSAGRHEGYQGDAKAIDAANKRIAAAEAERTQHVQSVMDRVNDLRSKLTDQEKIDNNITGKVDHDPASRSIPYTLRDAMTTDELAKYKELQDNVSQEENVKRGLKAGGVPDAPFKQNWHELAMKRMLRHAAENGYEQMAWTTGKQQADLYGLEHHFSRLEYDPESGHLEGYDPQGQRVLQEKVKPDAKSLAEYMGPELAKKMADKIQDYHDNDPGQPDPDMFYDHAREGYDIEEREVPDENHVFETTPEREAFDEHVAELSKKYKDKLSGLNGRHALWNDLKPFLSPEELSEGQDKLAEAKQAEEDQEQDRPTETQYHVTQNGEDVSGPHDTEDDADEAMRNHIDRDVQHEMENYESEKPETPTLSGLDLHHGGEFHKLLYDQMIPSFLKKYAKKWGAEVGTTDIKNMGEPGPEEYTGPEHSETAIEQAIGNEYLNLSEPQRRRLSDVLDYMKDRKVGFKEAMEAHNPGPIMRHIAKVLGGHIAAGARKATVHAIPITEEMRKSVMKQGQPIAKSEQPDRKKIFGQLGSALA
jgi:hypothetical protein